MAFEGTAVGAMTVLRGQIEERLIQNEDYRAMKALDRAIAEVQAPAAKISMSHALMGMPPVGPSAMPTVGEQFGLLQQKLADRFENTAAA